MAVRCGARRHFLLRRLTLMVHEGVAVRIICVLASCCTVLAASLPARTLASHRRPARPHDRLASRWRRHPVQHHDHLRRERRRSTARPCARPAPLGRAPGGFLGTDVVTSGIAPASRGPHHHAAPHRQQGDQETSTIRIWIGPAHANGHAHEHRDRNQHRHIHPNANRHADEHAKPTHQHAHDHPHEHRPRPPGRARVLRCRRRERRRPCRRRARTRQTNGNVHA